jgi:hypothetical protein
MIYWKLRKLCEVDEGRDIESMMIKNMKRHKTFRKGGRKRYIVLRQEVEDINIDVACRPVTRQRPRDRQLYDGR